MLVAAAIAAPLPFGSVLPASRTILALVVLAAFAFAAVADARGGGAMAASARPAAALLAVAGLGLVQSLPWPPALVGLLAPGVAAAWDAGGRLLGDGLGAALSVAPAASRRVALLWAVVAAALLAATAVGSDRRQRRLVGLAILAVALFEIVYGADNWFRGGAEIWGRKVPGDPGRLRGTFVNADHLAFFLEPVLAASFAWLWWAVRRLGRRESLDRALVTTTLPALAFVMVFVGLAFTGSRAGMAAAGLGLAAQAALLAWRYRRWQAALLGVGALVLGGGGLLTFGLQEGMGRWMSTSAYEIAWGARTRVYAATVRLWLESPFLGSGLGTYRQAFPRLAPEGLELAWHHAHSDVLELLATAGLAGLAIVTLGLVPLARRLLAVADAGRRSEERAAGLAAIGALVAALFHSALDFGLAMPANALVLALLLGLAAGCPLATPEERAAERQGRHRRRGDQPVPGEPRRATDPGTG